MQNNTHVLGSSERDTVNARDTLKVQLLNGLSCLLLVSRMDHSAGAGWAILASLNLGIGAVFFFDGGLVGGLIIRKFLDSGVRHFGW